MKDFMLWWSTVGTDFWFTGVWEKNTYLIIPLGAVVGAFVKGKWVTFFENLKTALPFFGSSKRF